MIDEADGRYVTKRVSAMFDKADDRYLIDKADGRYLTKRVSAMCNKADYR